MRSLVVCESWFGNTRQIAEEIADALGGAGEAEVLSVDDPLPSLDGVDLIVVGAPTHVHGLSSGRSR
jgi:flavodoxin